MSELTGLFVQRPESVTATKGLKKKKIYIYFLIVYVPFIFGLTLSSPLFFKLWIHL